MGVSHTKLIELLNKVIRNLNLEKNIVAIYGYGSYFTGNFGKTSDIDLYFILNNLGLDTLLKIRKLKKTIEKEMGRKLFVNTLLLNDLNRTNIFYHRNREIIFYFDFLKKFIHLYGKKVTPNDNALLHHPKSIINECLKNIHLLMYMSRKIIVNKTNYRKNVREIIKNLIKVTRYINLLNGFYTYTTEESLRKFEHILKKKQNVFLRDISVKMAENEITHIVGNIMKRVYYSGDDIDPSELERVLNFFELIAYNLINSFDKFPLFDPKRSGVYDYSNKTFLKIFSSKIERRILFFPGIPNNPKEEFIWDYTLLGNIYLLDNSNYVNIFTRKDGLTNFEKTVEHLLNSIKPDCLILSSFSTLFFPYFLNKNHTKKIVLMSPIITIDKKVKDLLRKSIDRYVRSRNLKKDDSKIELFLETISTINSKSTKMISNSDKEVFVSYSKIDEHNLHIPNLRNIKKINVSVTEKELHGYKLILDFDVWSALLNFLNEME